MKKWIIIIIGIICCVYIIIDALIIIPKAEPPSISFNNSRIVYSLLPHGFSILNNDFEIIGFWKLRIPLNTYIIKTYAGYITPYFTWSMDGQKLVARVSDSSPEGGYPVVIDKNGNIEYCPERKSYWGNHRTWMILDNIILTDAHIDHDSIILFDIKKCKLTKILYETTDGKTIADETLSKTNMLAFELYRIGEGAGDNELVILNPDGTTYMSIKGGLNPSWSKDGSLLVYTDLVKGIVIYNTQNHSFNEITNLGVDWYTMTSISDDNRYLIYNGFIDKKMMLILVDLDTNEQRLLVAGYYPNWRWEP